jgi:hypothetical protein
MEFNLEAARIKFLPDDAFYIADFITEEEEELLLQKVCFGSQVCSSAVSLWPM